MSDLTSFDRAAAVLVLSNGLVSAITCFEIKKIVLVYRGVAFKQFRHCQLKTKQVRPFSKAAGKTQSFFALDTEHCGL